jgi:hypothetical protein
MGARLSEVDRGGVPWVLAVVAVQLASEMQREAKEASDARAAAVVADATAPRWYHRAWDRARRAVGLRVPPRFEDGPVIAQMLRNAAGRRSLACRRSHDTAETLAEGHMALEDMRINVRQAAHPLGRVVVPPVVPS